MLSVTLPVNLEKQLDMIVQIEKKTKTEIIQNALLYYIKSLELQKKQTPYTLGKNLFGKYSSGKKDLSSTYKIELKKILEKKFSH